MYNKEKIGRPDQLTNQFVKLLHQSKGHHLGYFQIVQFHQKRQKFYSTHISDGFFKCKVIFRDKASKQIDQGQIKLFSVLYGPITNQGDRIFMVFDSLKAWDYPRTVGVIRSWKIQTPNLYIHGSSLLTWGDDQTVGKKQGFINANTDNDEDSDGTASCCASQMVIKKRKNSKNCQKGYENNNDDKSLKIVNLIQNSVFSFGSCNDQTSMTAAGENEVQSTQSLNELSKKAVTEDEVKQLTNSKIEMTPASKKLQNNKSKRLLIVNESQTENIISLQKDRTQMQSVSKKKIIYEQSIQTKILDESKVPIFSIKKQKQQIKQQDKSEQITIQHSEDDSDDQEDIFLLMRAQVNKIKQKKVQSIIDDSTAEIYQQINQSLSHRFQATSSSKKTVYHSLQKQSIKKGSNEKSIFACLMQDDQQDLTQRSKNTKFVQKTPQQMNKAITQKQDIQFNKQGEKVTYSDLREAIIHKNKCQFDDKWIIFIVHSIKCIYEGNISKIIVIAQQFVGQGRQCGQIFNLIAFNPQKQENPFQERSIYRILMKGVLISNSGDQYFHAQVFLKTSLPDLRIQKLSQKTDIEAQSEQQCFLSFQKIESVQQGLAINMIGIVLSYKNFSNKKSIGWTNIFTLASPFSTNTIDFTIFDPQKLIYQPGSPAIIYNTPVKIYQGKKTLGTKYDTAYYFGRQIFQQFGPRVNQLRKIQQWFQEGNTINSIVGQNYYQIPTLLNLENCNETNVVTSLVRITKISRNFLILICDKCNKKIFGGVLSVTGCVYCQTCGRRDKPLKQLQLSLQVSDNVHSCYVEFNHYDSCNLIGEEGEKMGNFVGEMIHRWVKLWLKNNGKYKALVRKMEVIQQSTVAECRLEEIKKIVKFL